MLLLQQHWRHWLPLLLLLLGRWQCQISPFCAAHPCCL
jgi:hypothetical protein